MRLKILAIAAILALFAIVAGGGAASAANSAGNSDTFVIECENGGTYLIAVGRSDWSPGRVIEVISGPAAHVLIPFAFTFTFVPEGGGEPEVESISKPGPGPNELTTCPVVFEEPGFGTFTVEVEAMIR